MFTFKVFKFTCLHYRVKTPQIKVFFIFNCTLLFAFHNKIQKYSPIEVRIANFI